ncbi:hypothetical protein OG196_24350 [Kitasatospora purpeofusca]|uniref:hypothetical protein n=1 Tax=Kitasatospora purpeofusca TaxID=67352 RepID=UPI002E0D4FEE|nr:hypothetical protein OG196_24350 [Kitasatospora purpeofusca]
MAGFDDAVAGTADDLVADAHDIGVRLRPRTIKDWVENGLLAPPLFRKTTQRGSDARLFPPEQRVLFRKIVEAKQRSPLPKVPHHTVAPVIIHMWLEDSGVVTDEQARRSLRTYSASAGAATAAGRRATARAVIAQFAHPEAPRNTRREVERLLVEAEETRNPRWEDLGAAMKDLVAPWRDDGRARLDGQTLGLPEMPMTFDYAVLLWMIKAEVSRDLRAESIQPRSLLAARREFRQGWAEYQRDRPALMARVEGGALLFAQPDGWEARIREHVDAFASTIGRVAGQADVIMSGARGGLGWRNRDWST